MVKAASQSDFEAPPWQRLMPLLRSTVFTTASQMRGRAVTQPVDDRLCVVLAIDHEHGIEMVGPEQLEKWGVPTDQLFNAAFHNLNQQVGPRSFEFTDLEGEREVRLLRGVAPYGYQTSLAFCTTLVRQLAAGREGAKPVIFVPSRNDMFVVPSDRPDLLAAAFDEALALYQQHPRPLSPVPYTYDARGLLTFWWPDQALRDRFRRATAHRAHGEYESQRAFFDSEPVGIAERDEHNAVFLPIQAKVTGEVWSIIPKPLLDAGRRVLLPAEIDYVGYQESETSEPLFVDRSDMVNIVDAEDYYPDLRPMRTYVTWPNAEQWAELQRNRVRF